MKIKYAKGMVVIIIKRPKVSVIIPSYNHEKYIDKAIQSVLLQSFEDFELIVADDCSIDNSLDKINSFNDNRIKKHFFTNNIGTVRTFNYLLDQVSGEYIATLGSDDIWYQDKLKKQVDFLDNNSHIGACFSWAKIIDEKDEPYETNESIDIKVFFEKNKTQGEWLRRFFDDGNHLCHSSSIIRTCIVNEIGNFKVGFRQLHDLDYWIRLINKYPIQILEENLIGYRRFRDTSQSVSGVTQSNSIRLLNESYSIFYNMFYIIDNKVFIDGFKDKFIIPTACLPEELICEKYFILLNYKIWDNINEQIAVQYLLNNIDNKNVLECLSNKYNYTLNDFYTQIGKYFLLYPQIFSIDFQNLKDELESKENANLQLKKKISNTEELLNNTLNNIYNSTSWRITKPLRAFKEIISKKKEDEND